MKNKSLLTKVLALFVCFGSFINLNAQTGLTWQDRGPNNHAGPVRAVLFDQQDASGKTLYAGALSGGIWKTVNQGLFWEKINLAGSNLAVSCMIQASDNKIYVGTGIYYDQQKANLRVKGTGLFVSTDGENFSLVEGTNGPGWEYINAIAIDNQNRIYVATPSGLMYRDGGSNTWQVASGTIEGAPVTFNGLAYDVETAASGLVMTFVDGKAYTSSNQGPTGFISQSLKEKNGTEWTNPTKLPKNDISRMSFSISSENPNVVYASAATGVGSLEGVYYSQNGGIDWEVVLPFTTGLWNIFAGGGTNYGAYNNQIIVDPADADRVIVGCVNMYVGVKFQDTGYFHWNGGAASFSDADPSSEYYIHSFHNAYTFHPANPQLMAIASDGGVTLSKNGGQTFSTINKLLGVAHVRTMAVDNYDNLLAGTFGSGVQFLNAESGNPTHGTEIFDGTLTGNGGSLLMSQISTKMFFMNKSASVGTATFDNFVRTDDRALSFSATFKDGAMTTGAELMPMAVYETYYDPSSIDSVRFVAIKKYQAGTVVSGRSGVDRFPFAHTLTDDLDSLSVIMIKDPVLSRYFFGWKDKFYMSMNLLRFAELPEWWKLAAADGNITAIAYSKNCDFVYFGTDKGTLYRLKNVAAAKTAEQASMDSTQYIITVEQIATNPNSAITSIAADKSDDNHLIYTIKSDDAIYSNKFIYRSVNAAGATPAFTSIHGNLPNAQINATLIEMNGNMALVGTQVGLYSSSNIGGASWTKETAMGTVPVTKLIQQTMQHAGLYAVEAYKPNGEILSGANYPATTNYGKIYVATFGRGIWSSDNFVGLVDQPSNQNVASKSALTVRPNPVTDKLTLNLNSGFTGNAKVSIYDLKGQMMIQNDVEITKSQPITVNCSSLNPGTYMVRLTGGQLDVSQKFVVIK